MQVRRVKQTVVNEKLHDEQGPLPRDDTDSLQKHQDQESFQLALHTKLPFLPFFSLQLPQQLLHQERFELMNPRALNYEFEIIIYEKPYSIMFAAKFTTLSTDENKKLLGA